MLDVRHEEQENAKEQGARGLMEKDDKVKATIISDDSIPTKLFKKQEPLFKPVRSPNIFYTYIVSI